MQEPFVFVRIRSGAGTSSQVVIEALFDEKRFADDKIRVLLAGASGSRKLSSENIVRQAPLHVLRAKGVPGEYKEVYVLIDIGTYIQEDGLLQLTDAEDGRMLYECPMAKVREAADTMNYFIEEAKREDDRVRIKGWVVSADPVSVAPVKADIKYGITWFSRMDVKSEYPEQDNETANGFLMELRSAGKHVPFAIETGAKKVVIDQKIFNPNSPAGFFDRLRLYARKFFKSLKERGIKGTVRKILQRTPKWGGYDEWRKTHMAGEAELKKQRRQQFEYSPKFSIVVPLYETDPDMLAEMIASVQAQSYENWELCLSDGSRNEKRLDKIIKKYTDADSRIKYIAKLDGPLPIPENTNQAISIATGDYIVLGDHDDTFAPEALYECVLRINEDREIDVLYTDEDKLGSNGKTYYGAYFKPDFNIDLLTSNNYICHMFVADRALAQKVGLFRSEYNGSQDYDFILRCVEQAKKICHIPKVLYHWRAHSNSTADVPETKMYAFEAGKKAIEDHYKRIGLDAEVFYGDHLGLYNTKFRIIGEPLISIIIPNKDHISDLKKCMDSIDSKSDYRNFEYIIVENNSEDEETFAYYSEIEKRDNVRVVTWTDEFNFSAINNYGAKFARGEYLLLLNNDTEIINDDCLSQMLGYCQRDDVGIVGARLYYPDGVLQHAGVIVGMGGIAGHAFVGLHESDGLYQSRSKIACDYSAVTAACMMVKKRIFDEVGGLEESFRVAFNDIDFCMKVRQTGALVVYNANAKLYHYESKSRGLEDTPEKVARFNSEIERFQSRWGDILEQGDPYYNPNLTLNRADFSLRLDGE